MTPAVTAAAAHLAAAAAANSQLLRDVGGLAEVHKFAQQMRDQVVAVHRHMRLPHLGASRSVPYAQLYVSPVLLPEHEGNEAPDLEPPPHAIEYLLRNGRAMVLLDGLDELVEPALRRRAHRAAQAIPHSS